MGGAEGGAPRYQQRSYGQGGSNAHGGGGNRPTYAPKPSYAPPAEAHAAAPAQAETGLAAPRVTGGSTAVTGPASVGEGMGIADDDIPF